MDKKLITFLVLIVLLIILSFIAIYESRRDSDENINKNLSVLIEDFRRDAVKAKDQWVDKELNITGMIYDVSPAYFRLPYKSTSILCTYDNKDGELTNGNKVKAKIKVLDVDESFGITAKTLSVEGVK